MTTCWLYDQVVCLITSLIPSADRRIVRSHFLGFPVRCHRRILASYYQLGYISSASSTAFGGRQRSRPSTRSNFEMIASPLRMLLRASVASISRPVQSTRLPQTLARTYSQKSPLYDTLPPPHTEPTPPPTPPAPLPSVPTLDFGTDEPTARMRTGAKSAKDSLSSIERRRRRLGWVSSGLLVTGLVGGYIYLGREPDEKIDVCPCLGYS